MPWTRFALIVVGALVGFLAAPPMALADENAGDASDWFPLESISFLVENDSISGTDRHYTNGLKASVLLKKDRLKKFSRWLAKTLKLFPASCEERLGEDQKRSDRDQKRSGQDKKHPDACERRIGFALGQNIYTPGDLAVTTLQTEDRPYAGWLYAELGMTAQTENRLDSVAISLGVIGPASQADDVQRAWHRLLNITQPRGWQHQLKNEPALNISYQRSWRYFKDNSSFFGFDADAMSHLGFSLGNVFTNAAAGLTVRIGDDFKGDFGGPPRIRPSMPGAAHFKPPEDGFGWYLFAGIEGRAVARNIFLDGNTFTDSHSVDKKILVGDAQLGLALLFKPVRITYTQVFRTIEFDGQVTPHHFGAFSVTWNF